LNEKQKKTNKKLSFTTKYNGQKKVIVISSKKIATEKQRMKPKVLIGLNFPVFRQF